MTDKLVTPALFERIDRPNPVVTADEKSALISLRDRINELFPARPKPGPADYPEKPDAVRVVDQNGQNHYLDRGHTYDVDERGCLDVFGDDEDPIASFAPGFWANARMVRAK